jgi:hypothetical protein
LSIGVLALVSVARAREPCLSEVVVETTGYGVIDGRGATGLNTATLDALAQAVAQVRGAFVTVETELVDAFTQTFDGATTRTVDASAFRRVIEERASGLVLGYEVLSAVESAGAMRVTARVTVCADARLSVRWTGPRDAEAAFLGALRTALAASGWHVVTEPPGASSDLRAAGFRTGSSHIVSVYVRSNDRGAYRDLHQVEMGFSVRVQSAIGGEVVAALDTTVNSVGRTQQEAEAEAARTAAGSLANDLLRAVRGTSSSLTSSRTTVVFSGIRRSNTPLELQRALLGVPGVQAADVLGGTDGNVQIDVHTSRDLCAVASDLASDRRFLLHLDACDGRVATIRVLRE